MPATALAAMSASIEGATPQPIVPAPINSMRTLSSTQVYMHEFNEPNSVKPKSIAPRRPRISASRPTQVIYFDPDGFGLMTGVRTV